MGKSKDLATGETRFVNTAGDTMTGALTVGGNLTVNTDADTSIEFKDGGTNAAFITAATGDELYIGANNEYAIRIKNDGTKDVTFDNGSRVTMNQPQFVLQGSYNGWTTINQASQWLPLTGSTAVATSTNNELAMNWTSSRAGGYNPSGNGINANTGNYTAPVNGTYMFTFQSYILKGAGGGGYIHINSYINGSDQQDYTIYGFNLAAGSYTTPEITKVIRMSANDTFAFRLYSNVTDYRIYPHYTCLTGYLLG